MQQRASLQIIGLVFLVLISGCTAGVAEAAQYVPTSLDIFKIIKEKIQSEESLIQQRVAWFLTANGFLFAAFGGLVLRTQEKDGLGEIARRIIIAIPVVGMFFSVATGLALVSAKFAMEGALGEWNNLQPLTRELFPSPRSVGHHLWLGGLASGGLCGGLGIVWLWLGLTVWRR